MIAGLLALALLAPGANARKTTNLVFVMTDGLRWQEVFQGIDSSLINKELGGVDDADALRVKYWRNDPAQRRQALLPFLWSTFASNGQIYGNPDKQAPAVVTNGLNFSYPGYNEALCGFPGETIRSNDKIPNPNASVLEWLNGQAAFRNQVAGFAAWDVFPFILNVTRSKLLVNAGYNPFPGRLSDRMELLNQLKADSPHFWEDEPFDNLTFQTTLEYMRAKHPRVVFLSLGETDEWAHAGNYREYLDATHRFDGYLRVLWDSIQNDPVYRGKTTLVISTDHGRGASGTGWKSHGEKIPESKNIWIGFLGPDTEALGEVSNAEDIAQNRIAATIGMLLGENYQHSVPRSGKPIEAACYRSGRKP